MKNLYLFVYEQDDINTEADWFFRVIDTPYLSTSDEEKYIAENMIECDQAETKAEALSMLGNFWSQKVDMMDGYKITLSKEEEVTEKHDQLRNILIDYGNAEFGDAIIDNICALFGYPDTNSKETK